MKVGPNELWYAGERRVEAGSAGAAAAEENGFEIVEAGAQTDALLEVASGASDACIIDITMANAMIGK